MADLFDHTILCTHCHVAMVRGDVLRNGFAIRCVACPNCNERILHPDDLKEYEDFKSLRSKKFSVKLRIVGNSYAVSIPREIIDFMHTHEREPSRKKVDDMVRLSLEELGRLSLHF